MAMRMYYGDREKELGMNSLRAHSGLIALLAIMVSCSQNFSSAGYQFRVLQHLMIRAYLYRFLLSVMKTIVFPLMVLIVVL